MSKLRKSLRQRSSNISNGIRSAFIYPAISEGLEVELCDMRRPPKGYHTLWTSPKIYGDLYCKAQSNMYPHVFNKIRIPNANFFPHVFLFGNSENFIPFDFFEFTGDRSSIYPGVKCMLCLKNWIRDKGMRSIRRYLQLEFGETVVDTASEYEFKRLLHLDNERIDYHQLVSMVNRNISTTSL
jgi:hypothetical protein